MILRLFFDKITQMNNPTLAHLVKPVSDLVKSFFKPKLIFVLYTIIKMRWLTDLK